MHPISIALKNAYSGELQENRIRDYREIAGKGICAFVDGKKVQIGNDTYMKQIGAAYQPCHKEGTLIHVVVQGEYMGHIVIADTLKPDAKQTISKLKSRSIQTVMLTGDKQSVAQAVAKKLQIERFFAEAKDGKRHLFSGSAPTQPDALPWGRSARMQRWKAPMLW